MRTTITAIMTEVSNRWYPYPIARSPEAPCPYRAGHSNPGAQSSARLANHSRSFESGASWRAEVSRRRVSAACRLAKTAPASPSSATRPRSRTMTRPAIARTTLISWVMRTMVRPSLRLMSRNSERMDAVVSGSSAEVASSDKRIAGSAASDADALFLPARELGGLGGLGGIGVGFVLKAGQPQRDRTRSRRSLCVLPAILNGSAVYNINVLMS
jgi:hypothetical protein